MSAPFGLMGLLYPLLMTGWSGQSRASLSEVMWEDIEGGDARFYHAGMHRWNVNSIAGANMPSLT